ncbi:MAG: hypothetical protein WD696_08890 [Bryobacteraceae bacterium]
MGKKSNFNQDYFKIAGRELPGKDVPQEVQKQQFAEIKAREKRESVRAKAEGEGTQMSEQTSTKTGKQSSAKKDASTRHGEEPQPATSPVDGAFGKEPSPRRRRKKVS